MKALYLILALIGAVVPSIFRALFVIDIGFKPEVIFQTVTGSYVSFFLASNIIITAISVFVMCYVAMKQKVRHLWVPVVGTLLFGPAFGLPMLLFFMEKGGKRGNKRQ